MSTSVESLPSDPQPQPTLSPIERFGRIFTRPADAWGGLEDRQQWWIPLVVLLVIQVGLMMVTYHRAMIPMMLDQWDQAVVNGQMPAEQVDKLANFFEHDPRAMLLILGQQLVAVFLFSLVTALVVWFGLGFILGGKLRYRLALEIVCWSAIVQLPETLGTFAWAWFQETFKGIHFGLAVLLPEMEHPTKLHTGLTVLLDAIGPFRIWYLVVAILGGAALTGLPRKNVAWVTVAMYLVLAVFIAVVAAAFTPGA